ncbi:hypothetical protein M569_12288, partial [Genlisea aurea]
EFDRKQRIVGMQERRRVSEMFSPPTANQSWRRVLSMGNLLNGHEPVSREIVFSKADDGGIETHRMYVCGTSNDLRVALAVASCD